MKKTLSAGLMIGLRLGMIGTAEAATMAVEMMGYVSNKNSLFLNTSVQAGDMFNPCLSD